MKNNNFSQKALSKTCLFKVHKIAYDIRQLI